MYTPEIDLDHHVRYVRYRGMGHSKTHPNARRSYGALRDTRVEKRGSSSPNNLYSRPSRLCAFSSRVLSPPPPPHVFQTPSYTASLHPSLSPASRSPRSVFFARDTQHTLPSRFSESPHLPPTTERCGRPGTYSPTRRHIRCKPIVVRRRLVFLSLR